MPKIAYTAPIIKYGAKGEKTGWTVIVIPSDIAEKLKPTNKKDFKVKGKIDAVVIKRRAVMPMGDGSFILPLNADLRKAIAKRQGAMVAIQLEEDKSDFTFNADFIECLNDEPTAKEYFTALTGSQQRYFSKWIDSAKTEPTKVKRITMAVTVLAKKMGYPEMIRASQGR